ncbi:hypothetical protein [Gelidibacter sp.]|uniref:hypothetical protein n=1 Tax=Gelidibacter sp. TaxID=2018083 RepID=UPI002BED1875|nr:hypothetical protein [Gelidibacter sp.]HUH28536.1 hypothetical protein [Gelidibacter sp.]
MKKTIFLVVILIVFTGCKNESKAPISGEEEHDQIDVRELSGNFIYFDDAGVLQTKSELFGVVEDEKAQELIKRAEPLKDQPTDEVNVTLKVKVTKKPKHEEGWENRVEIIDIITVSKVDEKNSKVIKLKSQE